jgi:hypothetical protein
MPIFIVLTTNAGTDTVLKGRITEQFPSDNYEIGRGQWLVSFGGTTKELYTKLSPEFALQQTNPLINTVIFGIGGYFGVASRDMWEWLSTKLGGKSA